MVNKLILGDNLEVLKKMESETVDKERVEQMCRILKPTGSIFLHCDYNAQAYIHYNPQTIKQFVGSYRIDIYVIEGNELMFILSNNTSMKSFLYGKGTEWERSSFRLDGNMYQDYISQNQ
jgi:hypothetical protein